MPFKTKQALKICIQTTYQACLGSMLRPLGPHVGRGAHRSKPRTTWSTMLKDCKTVQSPPGVPMNGCTFSLHDHSPISINTSGPVWGRTRPAQHTSAKLLAPNRDHPAWRSIDLSPPFHVTVWWRLYSIPTARYFTYLRPILVSRKMKSRFSLLAARESDSSLISWPGTSNLPVWSWW